MLALVRPPLLHEDSGAMGQGLGWAEMERGSGARTVTAGVPGPGVHILGTGLCVPHLAAVFALLTLQK